MFVPSLSIRSPVSCSMFRTYAEIFSGKVPEDFGVSHIKGTSMTIPGQGSDLAQIIASIVKLPPLDERDFDFAAGQEVDERSAQIKAELDTMYVAEGRNLAEDAKARQEARRRAKNEDIDKADDESSKEENAE